MNRFAIFAESNGAEKSRAKGAPAVPNGNGVMKQTPQPKNVANVLRVIRDQKTAAQPSQARQKQASSNAVYLNGNGLQPSNTRPRKTSSSTRTEGLNGNDPQPASHIENKPFNLHENWCGVCSVKFPTKIALQNHIKTAVERHANYCNLCKRVFKDRNGLKNHLENSAGHNVFCNLCLSAFNDRWGLKNHFENNYSVGHQWVCLTCLEGFGTKEKLQQHLNTATKHVRCDTCHRTFKSQDERDSHWASTTKHKHCLEPGCDFDCRDARALEKHLDEDHFRCEICRAIFPSSNKLSAHIEVCQMKFHCDHCHKLFPNRDGLDEHRKTCSPCNEHGDRTDSGEAHPKRLAAYGKLVSKCWICSTPFPSQPSSQSLLIKHLETGKCPIRADAGLHLLQVLGKWWYSTLYMDVDQHAALRTGRADVKVVASFMKDGSIRPFICRAAGCGETFPRFSSLVFHVENGDCEWDVTTLRLEGLKQQFLLPCD